MHTEWASVSGALLRRGPMLGEEGEGSPDAGILGYTGGLAMLPHHLPTMGALGVPRILE